MNITRQMTATAICSMLSVLAFTTSTRLAGAAAGALPPLTTVQYQVTPLNAPGDQFQNCYLTDNFSASGTFNDDLGQQHGYIWHDGQLMGVDLPGFPNFALNGGNTRGLIAGCDGTVPLIYNARDGSTVKLPPIAGMVVAVGAGINNQGVVVGVALDSDGSGTGWTWNNNQYSFFTVPQANGPAGGTLPQGINDAGQVVGLYADSQGFAHGFLKQGSTFAMIDVPGADNTIPVAINNKGDVAGYYIVNGPQFHIFGFVLHQGAFVTVDIFGAPFCGLSAINDQGGISGLYQDQAGNAKAFVAKPQK